MGEADPGFDRRRVERAVREILDAMGIEGLDETPGRVAEAYAHLFRGLREDPLRHLEVSFDEGARDLVLMRDIPFVSNCEHHLLPMIGRAGAAYLPEGKVLGFSEFVRVVEGYAARPQLQERLTAQVADALHGGMGSRGSLVVVEAEHTCMAATGAWRPGARAVTSAARGVFGEDPALRAEVTALLSTGP
ncbi:GTP cyclohydrolase I FolE [Rubrobacter tropicus]|uniref:GTP cyclohydrolase 1 n=1 Tax=Rubrobacter tropicus TaxID=2653851 RepID=A0A6G8Q8B5_9ACTN|nr:GTP cyclohydrolase I [Rubrobacter tropicus]QIN82716.1 GTP cyclohydrolase I FolE [Rubrobacter tropicus]